MLDFLAGVPGKLKTLLDRLTATRATNLDNLDAAISTRVSSSVWTNALAAELDGLAPAIAAIPTALVKTVQYGTISFGVSDTSKTATLGTAVNTAKTVLIHLGQTSGSATALNVFMARITLTNTTTVTGNRGSQTGSDLLTVAFVAVEFY